MIQSNSKTQYKAVPQAQSKILESSQDNFFGFNTKPVKNRGLVGGLYDSLSYLYESVIQDYVESVYTDVIEGYTIATIKVLCSCSFLFLPVSWTKHCINLSADWLVCLRVSAGGEGGRYQPLRYHGQRLWASSSRRSLSTRDFHGYFSSFRGIVCCWILSLALVWRKIIIFF